jgi:hypothetical protein
VEQLLFEPFHGFHDNPYNMKCIMRVLAVAEMPRDEDDFG